jgi:hypothetical protein
VRTQSSASSEAPAARPPLVPRLEFRIERLRTVYRFSYAFHAREVRFERDEGSGFERIFPETFSFRADQHDPVELYLRLEDLWAHPRRFGSEASRRETEDLVLRLLAALPAHLADVLDLLEAAGSRATLLRASEDVAVFGSIVQRFVSDKELATKPQLRVPCLHMRKVVLRALLVVMEERVSPDFLRRYEAGEAEPESSGDPHDVSFFYALAEGVPEVADRKVVGAARRAYYRWLEETCLDESESTFEAESSPFDERELEVLRATSRRDSGPISRGRDFAPFLCRPRDRDCLRLLEKLERWFLRQYDVRHAAVVLHHADRLKRGPSDPDRVLSLHSTRAYLLTLLAGALPFLAAVFAYERAPTFFDALASAEVLLFLSAAFWFLAYRFMWKKDLTFFRASVPRIGAGIIVGYLPVFLIDEVWDLAEQPFFHVLAVIAMLGSTTLLYLYVEVQRRIGSPRESFARARGVFLLGLVQASGFGLVVTSLLGPLMAARNWGPEGTEVSLALLRTSLPPFAGQLPPIMGFEPLVAFPTAVLLMSFLSFFIGTFLQLLWEDIPITEPL